MKLLKAMICWFVGYCLVAGIAWVFVLGIKYPLWKLLIVSLIQVIVNTVQFIIVSWGDKNATATHTAE